MRLSVPTFGVTETLTGTVVVVAVCASDDGVVTNIAAVISAAYSVSTIRVFMANLLVSSFVMAAKGFTFRLPGRTPATGSVRAYFLCV